jgi:hypothetical protein
MPISGPWSINFNPHLSPKEFIMNTRHYQLAIIGASSLLLAACGTSSPTQQSKTQSQEEYKQQARIASLAISEAPSWMTRLPKESGVIYENGTAVSSDFAMADLKAKTIAYTKICTGAGGKVRSQMKMYRADNEGASVEQSELIARSICPDVDITGVETVEMKHVAEGNRIRTYVLVALPMGSKNVMKSTKDIQNRSADAFKELDSITKEQAKPTAPSSPASTQTPSATSQAKPAEALTPAPLAPTVIPNSGLITEPPAQVEKLNPQGAPVTQTPIQVPESEKGFMNSVKAVGNDRVIVTMADGTQRTVKLVPSNNPEYVARRAEALKKPGAIIGQAEIR